MIEVMGKREGAYLAYKCPFCRKKHFHGYIEGETIAHRISHCGINDESVKISQSNINGLLR
jgi:hypothetical protein